MRKGPVEYWHIGHVTRYRGIKFLLILGQFYNTIRYWIKSIQDFIKWDCTLLYMFRMYYCKTRKYGTIQILAPLAQIPLSAKFNSAPTMFQMYSISSSLKTINSIVYVWHFSQLIDKFLQNIFEFLDFLTWKWLSKFVTCRPDPHLLMSLELRCMCILTE